MPPETPWPKAHIYYDTYSSLANPGLPTQGNATLQRVVSGTQFVDTTINYTPRGNLNARPTPMVLKLSLPRATANHSHRLWPA